MNLLFHRSIALAFALLGTLCPASAFADAVECGASPSLIYTFNCASAMETTSDRFNSTLINAGRINPKTHVLVGECVCKSVDDNGFCTVYYAIKRCANIDNLRWIADDPGPLSTFGASAHGQVPDDAWMSAIAKTAVDGGVENFLAALRRLEEAK